MERPLALSALIASAAMPISPGPETGKCQMEWDVPCLADQLRFAHLSQWRHDPNRIIQRSCQALPQLVEEGRRGIAKGVALQRPEGDRRDVSLSTNDGSVAEQQDVSPGEIDGVVGASRRGHLAARETPVRAVHGTKRHVHHAQGSESWRTPCPQEASKPVQLNRLPAQAAAQIEGKDPPAILEDSMHQDGAVQPPADQHTYWRLTSAHSCGIGEEDLATVAPSEGADCQEPEGIHTRHCEPNKA